MTYDDLDKAKIYLDKIKQGDALNELEIIDILEMLLRDFCDRGLE